MAVTFDTHNTYTDEERRPLLSRLRKEVLALDAKVIETITPGQRIAYSKPGRRIFLEVKVQRHALVVHMVEVPDPIGLLSVIPGSHEWNQLARRAKILNGTDLDRLLPLIRVAWLRG